MGLLLLSILLTHIHTKKCYTLLKYLQDFSALAQEACQPALRAGLILCPLKPKGRFNYLWSLILKKNETKQITSMVFSLLSIADL